TLLQYARHPSSRPAEVFAAPAGDAVEVGDLLCPRHRLEVGEREGRGRRDEAVDTEPVGGGGEAGHRRTDRVDAPAGRRDGRRDRVRDGAAEQPGDIPGQEESEST